MNNDSLTIVTYIYFSLCACCAPIMVYTVVKHWKLTKHLVRQRNTRFPFSPFSDLKGLLKDEQITDPKTKQDIQSALFASKLLIALIIGANLFLAIGLVVVVI